MRTLEVILVLGLVAVLASILTPNFIRARAQGRLTSCKSTLKNIGTALEMYSTDHRGRYPTALSSLLPNYLKVLPTCPTIGRQTYSGSYQWSHETFGGAGMPTASRDHYTVFCQGTNHSGMGQGQDYPQYTSRYGLIAQ